MFNARDCAKEELTEYGIFIDEGEGSYTYLIPIERQDIIDWIVNNVTTPIKRLKKYSMYSPNYLGVTTWRRDDAKEFMSKK
jgi:hypothetical protein